MVKLIYEPNKNEDEKVESKELIFYTREELNKLYGEEKHRKIFDVNNWASRVNDEYEELPDQFKRGTILLTFVGLEDVVPEISRYASYHGNDDVADLLFRYEDLETFKSTMANSKEFVTKEYKLPEEESPDTEYYIHEQNYDGVIESFLRAILYRNHNIKIETDRYRSSYDDLEEYILNCVIPFNFREMRYGPHGHNMAVDWLHKHSEMFAKAEKEYGLEWTHGPVNTVFAEALRCCQRVTYRYMNDGDNANKPSDPNFISFCNLYRLMELFDELWGDKDCKEALKYFDLQMHKCFSGAEDEKTDEEFIKNGGDRMPYCELTDDDEYDVFSRRYDILLVEFDGCAALTAGRVEYSLIKTKEKFPDFLNDKNEGDSRRLFDRFGYDNSERDKYY